MSVEIGVSPGVGALSAAGAEAMGAASASFSPSETGISSLSMGSGGASLDTMSGPIGEAFSFANTAEYTVASGVPTFDRTFAGDWQNMPSLASFAPVEEAPLSLISDAQTETTGILSSFGHSGERLQMIDRPTASILVEAEHVANALQADIVEEAYIAVGVDPDAARQKTQLALHQAVNQDYLTIVMQTAGADTDTQTQLQAAAITVQEANIDSDVIVDEEDYIVPLAGSVVEKKFIRDEPTDDNRVNVVLSVASTVMGHLDGKSGESPAVTGGDLVEGVAQILQRQPAFVKSEIVKPLYSPDNSIGDWIGEVGEIPAVTSLYEVRTEARDIAYKIPAVDSNFSGKGVSKTDVERVASLNTTGLQTASQVFPAKV